MAEKNDLFNEWASGVSLANATSNEYFEEIPLELNTPATFQVTENQIPNPTEPPVVEPVAAPPEPESNIEVRQGKKGGQITLEKTSRGWKAVLDSGETSIPTENFYANNKDDLIFSVLEAKLEASKAVRRLKKEKLLGGEQPAPAPANVPVVQAPISSAVLSADDIMEIRNKIQENPAEALDTYFAKRFGVNPEQFAAALKVAEEAKSIVNAQTVKAEIEEVNQDFIRQNSDFAEHYSSDPENIRKLIARMAKAYLNKRVTASSPQSVVDNTIYELYTKGYWTAENLETAKEELIDSGLLEKTTTVSPVPPPPPSQEAPSSGPSEPAAPRIATQTGQPVGLVGLPARSSSPSSVSEPKPLTDVDLEKMPMNDLRAIAQAQLLASRTKQ